MHILFWKNLGFIGLFAVPTIILLKGKSLERAKAVARAADVSTTMMTASEYERRTGKKF